MSTDEQESKMCNYLRDKLQNSRNPRGFLMQRREILTVGAGMDLTPEQSVELFRSLKNRCWRGEYVQAERFARTAAWISEVH